VPRNIEEFVAGLPNTRGSSAAKRGRPRKAGVAAPGNLAMDADTAIQNVLGVEGGYVNDAADRGGETNLGISSRANPDVDVKSLTPQSAAALYKERYWDAINADQLPPAIREIAFDTAVNMGPSTAIRLAQLSGGDPQRYLAERKKVYDAIVANDPSQRKFYDGWMNRLEGLAAKLGGAVIPSANAADMPAPVATLAANNGPVLREAVAAAGATPRPQTAQRPTQPTYSPDPEVTSQSMRIALQQRDELVRMAGMYQRSGMGQEYMQVRQQIMALDNSLVDIAGMHGISEMELTGSTARLAQAWSTKVGVPIELQRRQDNTYDILVNGRPEAQYVPAGEIMDTALSIFDPQYRERKGAWADKEHEARLKINEVMAGKTGDMIKELYVAQQKGVLDKELELLKLNMGWDIKGPAGDGTYLIRPPGDTPFYFDPAGGEIEIDGVKVPVTGARRVGGLSTPAGR
jgi:Glycosyl hydrolase 108